MNQSSNLSKIFVYNRGSSAHRGVWHLASSPVEITEVEEKISSHKLDIVDYHTSSCDFYYHTNSSQIYDYRRKIYRVKECTCGHTGKSLGTYTREYIFPAHTIQKIKTVACGSVKNLSVGNLGWPPAPRKKPKVGDKITIIAPLQEPYIVESDIPPIPFCGHCRKILNAQNTSRNP